jgi:Membrane bound FAD containing D-sorbitol dehydrogenase
MSDRRTPQPADEQEPHTTSAADDATRRDFLKRVGLAVGAGAIGIPFTTGAREAAATSPSADEEDRRQNFAKMSAALTGFLPNVISPRQDVLSLTRVYLAEADLEVGKDQVDQLIGQFVSLQGQSPQQIANTLLATASTNPPRTALLARSVVKMWYLGSWYSPSSASSFADHVVSPDAYTNGLAWRAAQAHAMGYSELSFGYWSTAPPALAAFGIGDGTDGGGSNG